MSAELPQELDGAFEALGDPVRRRLLVLLVSGEQLAGTLVSALQREQSISQPGVSQHLRVLREAGLVRVRVDGNRRWYALSAEGVGQVQVWLSALLGGADPLAPFAQPLDALATELRRGQRDRRPAGQSVKPSVGDSERGRRSQSAG